MQATHANYSIQYGIQRSLLVKPVGRQAMSLSNRRFSSSPVENEVRIVQLEGGNEGGCGTSH